MTGRALLQRLLEATPLPPHDCEINALLVAFGVMHDRRRAILAEVATEPVVVDGGERDLVDELKARQLAWQEMLATAKQATADQLRGTAKLRAYAAVTAGRL